MTSHSRKFISRLFPILHVSSTYGAFGQTCQKELSTSSSHSVVMTAAAQKQYTRQPSWQLRRKRSKHSRKYNTKILFSWQFVKILYREHFYAYGICLTEAKTYSPLAGSCPMLVHLQTVPHRGTSQKFGNMTF